MEEAAFIGCDAGIPNHDACGAGLGGRAAGSDDSLWGHASQ